MTTKNKKKTKQKNSSASPEMIAKTKAFFKEEGEKQDKVEELFLKPRDKNLDETSEEELREELEGIDLDDSEGAVNKLINIMTNAAASPEQWEKLQKAAKFTFDEE